MRGENNIKLLRINKKYLILIILIILGIAALATAGYFQFQKSPGKVIKKMIQAMEGVTSYHYLVDLDIDNLEIGDKLPPTDILGEGLLQELKKIKLNFHLEGDLDILDPQNPKQTFVFGCEAALEPLFLQLEMEGRQINQNFYFQLRKTPNLGFLDLTALENQWIKIGAEIIGKQTRDDEKTKELEELVKNKDFFTIKEVLKDEIINDRKTNHYKFTFNKEDIKDFIIKTVKVLQNQEPNQEEIEELDKLLEQLERVEGELWIGKKDYLLYKIKVFADFVGQGEESQGNFIFSVTLSNFNQDKNIEEPKDFKSIEEIFGNLSEIFKELPAPISQ